MFVYIRAFYSVAVAKEIVICMMMKDFRFVSYHAVFLLLLSVCKVK